MSQQVARRSKRLGWLLAAPLSLMGLPAPAQEPPAAAPPAVAPLPPVQIPPLSPTQMATALKALKGADSEGLDPKAYVPASPDDSAAVTRALLAYAHDLKVGRMLPGAFPDNWAVRPAPYDPAPGLAKALAEDRLQPWLDAQRPPYSGYHALKRGLVRYRAIAKAGGWKTVPAGPAMALGSKDPRVPALRARLAAEDAQLPADGPAVFDKPLQEAVARAQRRYGLKPDGVVAKDTLAYLNQPVGQRVLQILANMERWRWMPPEMPATRVQVNAGAAIVTLFKDDRPVLSMKAVSGKPGDETPMLVSAIHSVVINPPWNVPSGIAERELWPKERASPGYLARNGYRVIKLEGGASRLQQRSGDESALGRFKFDFDNPYAVYLHDTPAKAGFDSYSRQASHGCVRVEKPRELAEALLAGSPEGTPEAIEAKLGDGSKTIRVPLPEKVPVYILYWTAFASADGTMNFRSDPYDWDRLLLQRVGVLGAKV